MLDDIEIWKPVVGYEGYYEVSSRGRVRSVARTVRGKAGALRKLKGRLLAGTYDRKGYKRVYLCKQGNLKTIFVHRLVCLAFYGQPDEGEEVCHYDGNPSNNAVTNLRWDTSAANYQDRKRHGTTNSTLSELNIMAIRKDSRLHKEIALDYGVCRSHISKIKRRARWQETL